ncbi:MAG: ribose 5-phosphate isomerase B [Calditrichaeota bacterium]|nr:ribose 5-phosphate isomerase B [Calditrichota bacterium]MCB9368866.1 ribose 5-phosphate isomerase B [Calditrichota bacterium]
MIVAVGSDHAGFELKRELVNMVAGLGHQVVDMGTHSTEAADYPDFARAVAREIVENRADRGLIICGSGVGACVAANKVKGIRAGTCHDTFSARQGVEDDDMNALCLGARIIGVELAREVVRAFLAAKFSGLERHQRRLNKVLEIEKAGR